MSDKLKKIIEYGLYGLIFLLPWQTRLIIKSGELGGGYSEYGTISLYLVDILLAGLLILFAVYQFKRQATTDFKLPKMWFAIGLFELAAFVSIFFASDKLAAVYHYLVLLLGLGLFWLASSRIFDRAKLTFYFLAGAGIQAGLGAWQFFTQATFANKWLGVAAHNAAVLGTSVVETAAGTRWLRAYGGLDHPNVLGAVLTVSLLLLAREKFKVGECKSDRRIFLFYTLLLIISAGIFFSFSRAAWLALAAALLSLVFLLAIFKEYIQLNLLAKVILPVIILLGIFAGVYRDLTLTRISSETRLESISTTQRLDSWAMGRQLIGQNWFFGTGIGNYTRAMANIDPGKSNWYYQPAHNIFILIWAESGVLGLFGFLGFNAYLGWLNFKKKKYANFSILIALAVLMIFDHWLWSLHFGVLFYWLAVGLIAADETGEQ